jgi:hypothetical protein
MGSIEKFLGKVITVQLLINVAAAKIVDVLIFKMLLHYADDKVNLDFFEHSKELIISFAVILLAYFAKD